MREMKIAIWTLQLQISFALKCTNPYVGVTWSHTLMSAMQQRVFSVGPRARVKTESKR